MGNQSSKQLSGKLGPFLCPQRHALEPLLRHYTCDVCGKLNNNISMCCLQCNYDACLFHHIPQLSPEDCNAAEGVALRGLDCPAKHRAKLLARTTSAWKCDVCEVQYPIGSVSVSCRDCDYDECVGHRLLHQAPTGNPQQPHHFCVENDIISAVKSQHFQADVAKLLEDSSFSPTEANAHIIRKLLHVLQAPPPGSVGQPASLKSSSTIDALASTAVTVRSVVPVVHEGIITSTSRRTWGISSDMWTKPSVYDAPYISINNDPHSEAVRVKSCAVDTEICALLARTTIELTFANSSSRQLEGELTFPLPEAAVVCGYALDVAGEMVAASLVEAKEAEKIYEAEVKKGIDPGLLQKVAAGGNVFKTRIFPLPPNGGTRRLSLTYTQPLDALDAAHGGWFVSLAFKRPVSLTLRGRILATALPPVIDGHACATATVTHDGDAVYTVAYSNPTHEAQDAFLRVAIPLPSPDAPCILVERAPADVGGGLYFAISDVAPQNTAAPSGGSTPQLVAHKMGIIWDASLSRLDAHLAAELDVLSLLLSESRVSTVDVYVVRDSIELFENLAATSAVEHLRAVPADGATCFRDLDALLSPRLASYSRIALFSDGQSSLGDGSVACIESGMCPPVVTFTSSAACNTSQLQHYWASATGGVMLRVGGAPAAHLVAAALAPSCAKVLRVSASPSVDANPQRPVSISGSRYRVTGHLPEAAVAGLDTVAVTVAVGGELSQGRCELRRYEVPAAAAPSGNVLQTLWAQQRVEELEVFPERNRDAILALGRRFGIVTASTSLLVLETLEQHLEHRVVPHPSRAAMHRDYIKRVSAQRTTEADRITAKLGVVRNYWAERQAWYKKDFDNVEQVKRKKKEREECSSRLMSASACLDECESSAAPQRCMRMMSAQAEMCSAPCPPPSAACAAPGSAAPPPPRPSSGSASTSCTATATVRYWTPDTPYLAAIAACETTEAQYRKYIELRGDYIKTPAYYFDVAAFFLNPATLNESRRSLGIRILSNIAELALDNSRVLRVLGYKLYEAKAYAFASEVFCRVAVWRPFEPQSYRDFGLTMLERGWYQQALNLLWQTVTMEVPSDFAEIEVECLWEIQDLLCRAERAGVASTLVLPPTLQAEHAFFVDTRMPLDLRVTMMWDQDNVDLDLHVVEPSGEEAYYGHRNTESGGLMSRDFRRGYGPESYVVKRAQKGGTYRFKTNYFASHQPQLTGPTVAILTITTNFLRADQSTVCTLIRLNEAKSNGEIGAVTVQ